ncbi:MAG: hypothetical protein R3B60_01665 [Candidatus Paceibacterota bacterium]
MKEVAKKVGLGKYSRDLAADLAHLAAGGSIQSPSTFVDIVRRGVEEKFPAPDSDGGWKISGSKYTKDRMLALGDKTQSALRYHQNVCDFLQTVEMRDVPGNSPLEQAMNLLKLLSKKKGGEGGGDNGEQLPIFTDTDNAEHSAKELNKLLDTVESLTDDEKELLDPSEDAGEGVAKEEGDDGLQKMKLSEQMLSGKEEMLKISRNLDKLTRMQVRRQRKVEADPSGDDVRKRPIAHMGELSKLGSAEWALRQATPSYFLYRAATEQLAVRERVVTIERKQLLYIIIDCSGSMGSGNRIYKAGGILMNRLKAVIEGEAELYVRLFDTELKEEYHASTPAEAKELIRHFTNKNYSGGSTDISGCSRAAQKRIEEIVSEGATYRPELVVVTDGDDKIDLTTKDFMGTKVHAFVVETSNDSLCNVAQATGGVGINKM